MEAKKEVAVIIIQRISVFSGWLHRPHWEVRLPAKSVFVILCGSAAAFEMNW